MPGWLTAIVAIAAEVPKVIGIIEQIIAAIKGHPSGISAGVAAVQEHLCKLPAPITGA